jgi:hypothetical protein
MSCTWTDARARNQRLRRGTRRNVRWTEGTAVAELGLPPNGTTVPRIGHDHFVPSYVQLDVRLSDGVGVKGVESHCLAPVRLLLIQSRHG